ncbi:YmdB family metallophosphoesterase [Candidatus Uhrbacteria bacterium]|nr:YmdB family metallophosphoesterase [Candidatus Uhrbacteria bacterium]
MNQTKILFFGDIVGAIGRKGVTELLPALREEFAPDFVIGNVENLSHGRGISAKTLVELDALGFDAYTSGNHVWENEAGLACFSDARWKDRLVRPANIFPHYPGRGFMPIIKGDKAFLLVNLSGQLFMKGEGESLFKVFDRIAKERPELPILVDLHAEATSEKEAFSHYVDGRALAVLGTHTHVPTADAKILDGGTAYITDVGRSGGYDSVVGFEKNAAVKRFLETDEKAYDPTPKGRIEVNAVLLTADLDTGRALGLDHIRKILDN